MVELKKKTTEQIVEDLKRGLNREANYRLLFERYHDQVYRFFQRKGMSREDCRDLTQDVFVSIHKGLKGLREHSQFHNWLFRIARNTFRNELEKRRAKKREGRLLSLEDKQTKSPEQRASESKVTELKSGPMEVLLEKERLEKLGSAIKDLPPQMRRCVQLRVLKALSIAEIAAVMRISPNTVKAHLHQARKVLREGLGRDFSEI